jgi:hypothetical protein
VTQQRLMAALRELGDAIIEYTEGTGAGTPPPPAPAAAFAAAQPAAVTDPGKCPVHGIDWRTTKRDGSPAKRAYCSEKDENGTYCEAKGPWLQSR